MAVLRIKPDKLSYKLNGEWLTVECDAVASQGVQERTFEDGVVRAYTFTVTLNPNGHVFNIGERVKMAKLGGEFRDYMVKGFLPYQHQSKVWL